MLKLIIAKAGLLSPHDRRRRANDGYGIAIEAAGRYLFLRGGRCERLRLTGRGREKLRVGSEELRVGKKVKRRGGEWNWLVGEL